MSEEFKKKQYISDNKDLIADWDWEKNIFSPSTISYGSAKVCYWVCSKCGHHWKTPAYSRGSNGCGCPSCAKINRGISKKKSSAKKNNFAQRFPNIAKEWHPCKNADYDMNNISAFSNIRAWWLCSECGNEWQTTVSHRTKEGNGCPVCSKEKGAAAKVAFHARTNNFAENYPELAKEWHRTKNGTISADCVSVSSNKKVWWKCSFCGNEWQTTVNHRTSGENCPACNKYQTSFPEQAIFYYISLIYPDAVSRKKVDGIELDIFIPSENIAIEYDGFIYHKGEKALLKDNKKDDFCQKKRIKLFRFRNIHLPNTNYAIRITCDDRAVDRGIIELLNIISQNQTIDVDLQRDRYEIIKHIRQVMIANSILVLKPELSGEWNCQKNGFLMPESVAANANYKVWWKCSKCGYEWQATPNHRFNGRGCPACAGKICVSGVNDLLTKNSKVAREWHYERNYPLKPENIAFKSNKKVWWKCDKGHEWETTVSERNRGTRSTNCPYCGNKKVLVGYNDLAATHPEIAKRWNYGKNGELSPTMLTAGSKKKVWWVCEKGHEWEAVVYSRKNATGCPKCYKESRK